MDKLSMREYIAELETRIDGMLRRWKKESRIENGEAVQIEWQFEQSHIIMNVFWHDKREGINIYCLNPHLQTREGKWKGLDKRSEKSVMDMIGNFAQIVMSMPH